MDAHAARVIATRMTSLPIFATAEWSATAFMMRPRAIVVRAVFVRSGSLWKERNRCLWRWWAPGSL